MKAIHEEFRDLLDAFMKDNSDGRDDLCFKFNISRPTVERWMRGRNYPHPLLCPPIIKYLKDKLQANSA